MRVYPARPETLGIGKREKEIGIYTLAEGKKKQKRGWMQEICQGSRDILLDGLSISQRHIEVDPRVLPKEILQIGPCY